jgi:hypothetical protein
MFDSLAHLCPPNDTSCYFQNKWESHTALSTVHWRRPLKISIPTYFVGCSCQAIIVLQEMYPWAEVSRDCDSSCDFDRDSHCFN